MLKRDFILRMIEMLAELIAGILGLIKKGKLEEAGDELDRAYDSILKDDADKIRQIPSEKIVEELNFKFNYSSDQMEMISDIFYAEAELFYAKGEKEECLESYKKSLLLLQNVMEHTDTFSFKRQHRISLLSQKIEELL